MRQPLPDSQFITHIFELSKSLDSKIYLKTDFSLYVLMEQANEKLLESCRVAAETEELGQNIIDNLAEQRQSLMRSRQRARETNEQLNIAQRLLRSIKYNNNKHKIYAAILIIVAIIVISLIVWGITK